MSQLDRLERRVLVVRHGDPATAACASVITTTAGPAKRKVADACAAAEASVLNSSARERYRRSPCALLDHRRHRGPGILSVIERVGAVYSREIDEAPGNWAEVSAPLRQHDRGRGGGGRADVHLWTSSYSVHSDIGVSDEGMCSRHMCTGAEVLLLCRRLGLGRRRGRAGRCRPTGGELGRGATPLPSMVRVIGCCRSSPGSRSSGWRAWPGR